MTANDPSVEGQSGDITVEVSLTTHAFVEIRVEEDGDTTDTVNVPKGRWVTTSGMAEVEDLFSVDCDDLRRALKDARSEAMLRWNWRSFMIPRTEPVLAPTVDQLRSYTDPSECDQDVPTFEEVWSRRDRAIQDAMKEERFTTIVIPTAGGKTYTIATTEWAELSEITGDQPVIHLSMTKKARDQAVKEAEEANIDYYVLEGRLDICGYAAGEYDDELEPVDGMPVSEWFEHVCGVGQMSFSEAKTRLEQITGQEHDCSDEHDKCPGAVQFDEIRDSLKDDPEYDVIFTTHAFAHVPLIRHDNNLAIDEAPSAFSLIGPGAKNGGRGDDGPLHQGHVEAAVTAFLTNADAPIQNVDELLTVAKREARGLDYQSVRGKFPDLYDAFHHQPDADWYWDHPDASKPTRAFTRALWEAARKEPNANERRSATVQYRPPRLTTGPKDEDEMLTNKKWLTVVLDKNNDIGTLRITPNFDDARSVIGLDAHPCEQLWRVNVGEGMDFNHLLDDEERRLFRRYRRRLLVIQCGSGDYSYNNPNRVNETKLGAFFDGLRHQYGERFRSAIPPKGSRELTKELMVSAGVDEPLMMHQEAAKSRNDLQGERIGSSVGCGDPGDNYVLDLLAECGLDAHPKYDTDRDCNGGCGGRGCKSCQWTGDFREGGRGFIGPDADAAREILASVREQNVAQSVGRWAREPTNPDDWAAVFAWGQAVPDEMVDFHGVTVAPLQAKQQAITEYLYEQGEATAKEIAETIVEKTDVDSCTKEHVRQTMNLHIDHGNVSIGEEPGYNGANLYIWENGRSKRGLVDFTLESFEPTEEDHEPAPPIDVPAEPPTMHL